MEAWLSSIGLGERVAAFRNHGISADQLTELTEDDLRELGLTIGERKRFRRAVAALRSPSPDEPPLSALPVLETTRAERRPLTMMFVDLVNSSSLGERLEPEDLLEVIRRYRELCGAAITRYGGHIARLVGDGILAYFCYPVANENDPERAVRAALDITRHISELNTPAGEPLNVRIGIATGRVIVSDLFAGGEDRRSIIGSTPNLAARLQGFVAAGGIAIADETHEQIAALFSCEDLGEREVRGFEQHHRAWRVLGEAPPPRANFDRRLRRLTAFHDRVDEFSLLSRYWRGAAEGHGNTVVVIGEAGIGKSRLVQQFVTTLAEADARIVHLAASAFDEDSPLRPVIVFLRSAAQLDPDTPREVALARLETLLAGDAIQKRTALPLFGELVGIAADDPAIRALPPEGLRERLLSVLVEQFRLWANATPLCLVVEDLQWLDPTSRELLERMVNAVTGQKAMLLLTTREGFDTSWMADRATLLPLHRLPMTAVAEMVHSLFGDRETPPQLAELIARRTDGVPLFIEAVTRSLLQLPSLPDIDDGPFDTATSAIPATLHQSLMARLDRSGRAKEVAQIAAVVGRSVRRDVLAEVSRLPDPELEHALATLAESDVLFPDDADAMGTYTFTHALLRDAAYDSLLRDVRRSLHLRVARALQEVNPHTLQQQPEVLALHLTEAGLAEEAAPHWMEASRRSLARSALTEATRLLGRGMAALEKRPETTAVLRLRLQLSGLLGPALIGLKGPGARETQELYHSARALCEELPEDRSHFPIYWGWWRVSEDFHTWIHRSEAMLQRAVRHNHPEFLLQAHHCCWASQYQAGNFTQCCEHIETGLAIYEHGDFHQLASLYGNHDAKVCAYGERAQVLWMQGKPLTALADTRRSIAWAEELDHLGSRLHAMDFSLLHRVYRRDYTDVLQQADSLVSFASEQGLDDHRAKGMIFRGWTVATQGDAAAGLKTLKEGFARQHDIGTTEDFPIYVCLLAEALVAAGMPEQAATELMDAEPRFERLGVGFWRSEVSRMIGEVILAAAPDSAEAMLQAQTRFAAARALADQQGVHMLGLRVAISEARLAQRQGRAPYAMYRLSEALARIEENDGSVDLRQANALAAELSDGLGIRSSGSVARSSTLAVPSES